LRAQPRAAARIEISAAVDDQQAKGAHPREHGAQRQFPQEEFARPVRKYRGTSIVHSAWTAEKAASPAVTAAARAPPQRREQTLAAAKTSRRPSVIPTLTG